MGRKLKFFQLVNLILKKFTIKRNQLKFLKLKKKMKNYQKFILEKYTEQDQEIKADVQI